MKFNAYEFIERAQQKIDQFRRSATLNTLFGRIMGIVVFAVMLTLFLQMVLRGLYSAGAQKQAEAIWIFFDTYMHVLWVFVLLSPLPKTLPHGNESMVPLIITMAFYVGLMLAATAFVWRGKKLREIAKKAQDTLDFQAPLLMQLEANGSPVVVGDIHGNGNHIASHNPVVRVIREGEKQSQSWMVISALAVPVIVWLLNHYLHVT